MCGRHVQVLPNIGSQDIGLLCAFTSDMGFRRDGWEPPKTVQMGFMLQ